MSISNVLDKKYNKTKSTNTDNIKCSKNSTDCMYLAKNGMCSAEWCLFDELPKMIETKKEINCIICGESKEVSIYNSDSWYICDKCIKKIKESFNE